MSGLLDGVPLGALIGGVWRDAADGRELSVVDPATGAELAQVADASVSDALDALAAADDAARDWAATAPRVRAEILRTAFDLLIAEKERFAALITAEMGKPLKESRGELAYGAEFLRWFSEEAVRTHGDYRMNPEGTGTIVVSRHPVGPCYLVTPWNFPLAMLTRKVGPALAAGCTVVVKPAGETPLTALAFADLLTRAGVPGGVVNVVVTSQVQDVSAALLADPRLRKISFTGSTAVGSALLAQASGQVLRASMELGGDAPFLVFDDADLDAAVEGAMLAKFRNIGQACTAANRFLVHRDVAEEFVAALTARIDGLRVLPGTEPESDIGPIIHERAAARIRALIDDARDLGATVHTADVAVPSAGSWIAPTVVTGVAPGMRIVDEEIFGPVVAVQTFDDEDEAVASANDSRWGLAGYAFTRDLARAHRLIGRLRVGMLAVNSGLLSNAAAPFGGVKHSGMGREGGFEGIGEYLETRYALIPAT